MADGGRPRTGLSLRIRLTLWYTASLALLLLLLGLTVYWQLRRSLVAQVDEGLQLVATQSLLNVTVRNDRLAFARIAAEPALARRLQDDFVVIHLYGPDGSLWDRMGEEDDIRPSPSSAMAFWTLTAAGEQWRVYDRLVAISGVSGRLQVIQDLELVNLTLQDLLRQMLLATPLALLAAGLGGYFLASRALRPIERLTQTARVISADDLSRRIGYHGPADEVGRLAVTLDDMLARLEAGFERERRFTADAAHELRTPLAALKGRIGVTLSQPRAPSAYVNALTDMEAQVDRLSGLSNDLLLIDRLQAIDQQPPREPIALADFVPAAIELVRPLAEAKSIELVPDVPDDLVLHGHLDLLTRLVLNLLDNAVKYTPEHGRVSVVARRQPDAVEIAVSDTGPGISPEHLPYLFDRFYRVERDRARTDGERSGSGLGLALAQEIARLHGGSLSVMSEPGGGATFTTRLPDEPARAKRGHS